MLRAPLRFVGLLLAIALSLPSWAVDTDLDGVPDDVEITLGLNTQHKDNDILGEGLSGAQLFAMQQYRDFLAREGDTGGVNYWAGEFQAGRLGRADMVESFVKSPEFQDVIAPITRLYFAYFLRIPDYAGLNYWITQYKGGLSLARISDYFAQSPEFATRYGALSNAGFVGRIYQNVLGRESESAGSAYWKGQLDTKAMTRGEVMTAFSESQEYRGLMSNEISVTMLYIGMLRRSPDSGGFSHWVSYLDSGNTASALITSFITSSEYGSRFQVDADKNGIRDEVDLHINAAHSAHPGVLRTAREYGRLLEKLATGSSSLALIEELQGIQTCAMELAAAGVITTWESDSTELLARTGFSKRRTINMLSGFKNQIGNAVEAPSCPFNALTGLSKVEGAKSSEVCRPSTRVYFVNGVFNEFSDAWDGVALLMHLGIAETPRSRFRYLTMHNPTRNSLLDVVEVFEQKAGDQSWSNFWRIWRSATAETWFLARIWEGVSASLAKTLTDIEAYKSEVSPLVAQFRDRINADLAQGNNVILVAHSQGNLFATEVFKAVKATASKNASIKLVGVGTPAASFPEAPARYTTAAAGIGPVGEDLVIFPLRSTFQVLPSNHVLTIAERAAGLVSDRFFHTFAGYLRHQSSRQRIRTHINEAIDELEVEGGCTQTTLTATELKVGIPGKFIVNVTANTTARTKGSPPGTVEITENGVQLCPPIALDGTGRGECPYKFNSVGMRNVKAVYSGGGAMSPAWQASETTFPMDVRNDDVQYLTVTANPQTPWVGQEVEIRAYHHFNSSPAGTVTMTVNGAPLCTTTIAYLGTALCKTMFANAGVYEIKATHSSSAVPTTLWLNVLAGERAGAFGIGWKVQSSECGKSASWNSTDGSNYVHIEYCTDQVEPFLYGFDMNCPSGTVCTDYVVQKGAHCDFYRIENTVWDPFMAYGFGTYVPTEAATSSMTEPNHSFAGRANRVSLHLGHIDRVVRVLEGQLPPGGGLQPRGYSMYCSIPMLHTKTGVNTVVQVSGRYGNF